MNLTESQFALVQGLGGKRAARIARMLDTVHARHGEAQPSAGEAAGMTERIAVVGGTGDLGLGPGVEAGEVLRGDHRFAGRVKGRRGGVEGLSPLGAKVTGKTNAEAAAASDIAILAIPDLPSDEMLLSLKPSLAGKLVISPIVPMEFHDGLFYPLLSSGSAAEKVASDPADPGGCGIPQRARKAS